MKEKIHIPKTPKTLQGNHCSSPVKKEKNEENKRSWVRCHAQANLKKIRDLLFRNKII
jgi:hypothetical protein